MNNHNDDLIQELREARKKERAALAAVGDAKSALRDRVNEWKSAARLVDEILAEVDTGSSGRPLIDAAQNGAVWTAEAAAGESTAQKLRGQDAYRAAIPALAP